jgi:5-methylcytosine-specific restriction enzyme subunit McrC
VTAVAPPGVGLVSPRVLRVREFESVAVDPDDILVNGRLDIYSSLGGKGYLEVRVGTERTDLRAHGHIGVIPVNDRLVLEVIPRVPIANLAHLLSVSGVSPVVLADAVRSYATEGTIYPSLAAVYATALRQAVDAITTQGLLREYERHEEITSFPRGRVQIGRTIQRAFARGVRHKAAIAYFQRSVDNPSNRCLLYAVWWLSQYVDRVQDELSRGQRNRIRRDLNYAWHALPGVMLDTSESFLDDSMVLGASPLPTLRSYYRPALDLALTIIGRKAVMLEGSEGSLHLPSLVVDMSRVFEAYVRSVLVREARERVWSLAVLDGNLEPPTGGSGYLFEDSTEVKATPDVVLRQRDGSSPAIPLLIEVKYKPAIGLPGRDDLNQAISYGAAFRSPIVVVVQPRADGAGNAGLHRLGKASEIEVYQYVMSLAADLQAEEAGLSDAIERLLR